MSTAPRNGDPFRVLVLCTANVCRSPVAAALLRRGLGGNGIEVASAGLRVDPGAPVSAQMAALMDLPRDAFGARQILPEMIEAAGLVLTMTRAHRAQVVSLVPTAVRRTFTLREFADLAVLAEPADEGQAPGDRLAALVAVAPRLRSRRVAGPNDDVEDPHGRGRQAHVRAVGEIETAVGTLAAVVAG